MSVLTDLRSALRQTLLTVVGLPAARAWENRVYVPVPGTPWLKETHLPSASAIASLGGGEIVEALVRDDGVYQITLFYPAGGDLKAQETLAGAIRSAFKPGTRMTFGAITATSRRAEVARGIQEPDWFGVPISIRYYLHRPNT